MQQIITTQQEILDFYNLLCGIKVEKLADDGTERLSNSTIDEKYRCTVKTACHIPGRLFKIYT